MQTRQAPKTEKVTLSIRLDKGRFEAPVRRVMPVVKKHYTEKELNDELRTVIYYRLRTMAARAQTREKFIKKVLAMSEAEVEQEFLRLVAKHAGVDLPPLKELEGFKDMYLKQQHLKRAAEMTRIRRKTLELRKKRQQEERERQKRQRRVRIAPRG